MLRFSTELAFLRNAFMLSECDPELPGEVGKSENGATMFGVSQQRMVSRPYPRVCFATPAVIHIQVKSAMTGTIAC